MLSSLSSSSKRARPNDDVKLPDEVKDASLISVLNNSADSIEGPEGVVKIKLNGAETSALHELKKAASSKLKTYKQSFQKIEKIEKQIVKLSSISDGIPNNLKVRRNVKLPKDSEDTFNVQLNKLYDDLDDNIHKLLIQNLKSSKEKLNKFIQDFDTNCIKEASQWVSQLDNKEVKHDTVLPAFNSFLVSKRQEIDIQDKIRQQRAAATDAIQNEENEQVEMQINNQEKMFETLAIKVCKQQTEELKGWLLETIQDTISKNSTGSQSPGNQKGGNNSKNSNSQRGKGSKRGRGRGKRGK